MGLDLRIRPVIRRGGALLALFGLLVGLPAAAGPYIGLDGAYSRLEVGSERFEPWLTRVRAGYALSHGFAAELEYGTSFIDDSAQGLDGSVPTHYGINLRLFGTGATRTRPYFLLGFGRTEVELDDPDGGQDVRETFEGIKLALGAEERLRRLPNLWVTGEVFSWIEKDDVNLRGLALGVRYDF